MTAQGKAFDKEVKGVVPFDCPQEHGTHFKELAISYDDLKSLVPKRYKSIFMYSRKMQSKFEIHWEMH
jgi:hypothetical protein